MKILFIGGTGNISAASVRLSLAKGYAVTLLNRGTRSLEAFGIVGAESLVADIQDEAATAKVLAGRSFDVVVNFIAFTAADIEGDVRLFSGKCGQYIFISSASAYQKPPQSYIITEETPLENPYWEYSRNKIAAETACMQAHADESFPVTIVRPSHTYETVIPVAIGGWNDFTIIERMRAGKPVIVHGDGLSVWTLTHAKDFAIGFVGLFGQAAAIGEAFHITSDEVMTWDQIYDLVGLAAGVEKVKKVHIPSDFICRAWPDSIGTLIGDKSNCAVFDNTKIKRMVPEFQARIPFKDGIQETVNWFDAKAERAIVKSETGVQMDAIIDTYMKSYEQLKPF